MSANPSPDRLQLLVEDATRGHAGAEPQRRVLFSRIQEGLELPFEALAFGGMPVRVDSVALNAQGDLVAACRWFDGSVQPVPFSELGFRESPSGIEWAQAYEVWRKGSLSRQGSWLGLYRSYTRAEAVATVAAGGRVEERCDGRFLLLSDAILCVADLDDAGEGSHFETPERFVWRPGTQGTQGLPLELRDGSPRASAGVALLVRRGGAGPFVYVGRAALHSWPVDAGTPREALFLLDPPVPREQWTALTGNGEWHATVDGTPHRLQDPSDLLRCLALWESGGSEFQLLRANEEVVKLNAYEQGALVTAWDPREEELTPVRLVRPEEAAPKAEELLEELGLVYGDDFDRQELRLVFPLRKAADLARHYHSFGRPPQWVESAPL